VCIAHKIGAIVAIPEPSNNRAGGRWRGYTLRMSWLARLLGRAPAAPAEHAATTVVIPTDLAERLTASGAPLAVAVEAALRDHLAEAPTNDDKFFWLTRDDERSGDLEERLRDRIAQRRSGEGDAER
jgi:hypothetical protein